MNRSTIFAAIALISLVAIAPPAQAQGVPTKAAEAARRQKLRAQQAAALAAATAPAVKTAAPPPTTPPPVVTAPTAVATVAPPKGTATPATSASAKPATSSSAKPAGSAAPATSGSAAPPPLSTHTETEAIALDLEALKKSRPDRRHAEFADLQGRWGGLLADPRAAVELKQHSSRVAYLQRIRALASKAKDTNFVKGVDALITKEETRDADALNALRSGALPVAAAAAAAAPTPAPGASK